MDEVISPQLLQLKGITKEFPGCLANDRIDLEIQEGEIHALLGENGAGKSTLVKIIYGVLRPDEGELWWKGKLTQIPRPATARQLGIGMVFQHFSLFEAMTTLQNVALALPPINLDELREKLEQTAEAYGLVLHPDHYVHDLSMGERQRIEIVRCLLQNPKLFILDEPTSVLTPQETEILFQTLRKIASEGRAILYISHKLEEVRSLCDRATILRGGKKVEACIPSEESAHSLAEKMIGQKIEIVEKKSAIGKSGMQLEVESLHADPEQPHGVKLSDLHFSVSSGEVLGIAGIAGNGQGELMGILTGETGSPTSGAIRMFGKEVNTLNPIQRRMLGAVFLPEERLGHAAVAEMTLSENTFLTSADQMHFDNHGWINWLAVANFSNHIIDDFDVRTTGEEALASSLSGGNLQKFIVGREILQQPKLLIISQPTWGVDAGAAAEIHRKIQAYAESGAAILLISQDLDEIFLLSHMIAVISQGTLSRAEAAHEMSAEQVGLLMGMRHDQKSGNAAA